MRVGLLFIQRQQIGVYSNDGPVQLTNSQKIRRFASQQVTPSSRRTETRLSMNVSNVLGVKYFTLLPDDFPFAQLMRSRSLEDAKFKQSLIQLQAIRAITEDAAMAKHWFQGGQIQDMANGVVMHNTYPVLRCSFCPRVFTGADRKRKCARHCRKLHISPSTEAAVDEQATENPNDSDIIELPARRECVRSADEFYLVYEESIPRWDAWASHSDTSILQFGYGTFPTPDYGINRYVTVGSPPLQDTKSESGPPEGATLWSQIEQTSISRQKHSYGRRTRSLGHRIVSPTPVSITSLIRRRQ